MNEQMRRFDRRICVLRPVQIFFEKKARKIQPLFQFLERMPNVKTGGMPLKNELCSAIYVAMQQEIPYLEDADDDRARHDTFGGRHEIVDDRIRTFRR